MKLKTAILAMINCVMLLVFIPMTADASGFEDTSEHWARDEINLWSEHGIIAGFDGQFRPNDNITRGEFSVILDRVMGYEVLAENSFSDLDDNYYTQAVLRVNRAGVILGAEGKVRPTDSISREEAAVMIARAMNFDLSGYVDTDFNDNASISEWARPSISYMTAGNMLGGREDGSFDPKASVTRAEVVKMLDNSISHYIGVPGEYEGDMYGNVVISRGGVTVSNGNVYGNVIIAEGVGEGDVKLEKLHISGDVSIRGGGENSVELIDTVVDGNLTAFREEGRVRVVVTGDSRISYASIGDGVTLESTDNEDNPFGMLELIGDRDVVIEGDFDYFENRVDNGSLVITGDFDTATKKYVEETDPEYEYRKNEVTITAETGTKLDLQLDPDKGYKVENFYVLDTDGTRDSIVYNGIDGTASVTVSGTEITIGIVYEEGIVQFGYKLSVYWGDIVDRLYDWGYFTKGTPVTITTENYGTEEDDKMFSYWTRNREADSESNPYTVIMPAERVIFRPVYKHRVTVNDGTGSGFYDRYDIDGKQIIVEITATPPTARSVFRQWETAAPIDLGWTNDRTTFEMIYAPVEITAQFEDGYFLKVINGTDMGTALRAGTGVYLPGESVHIVANTPEEGFVFSHWIDVDTGEKIDELADTYISMPAKDYTVEAVYVEEELVETGEYKLTVIGGTGSGTYSAGETVTIEYDEPERGFKFKHWQHDQDPFYSIRFDAYAEPEDRRDKSFTMPPHDLTLTAIYEEIEPIEVIVVNGSGSGMYYPEEVVNIAVRELEEGETFENWEENVGGGTVQFTQSWGDFGDENAGVTTYTISDMALSPITLTAVIVGGTETPTPTPTPPTQTGKLTIEDFTATIVASSKIVGAFDYKYDFTLVNNTGLLVTDVRMYIVERSGDFYSAAFGNMDIENVTVFPIQNGASTQQHYEATKERKPEVLEVHIEDFMIINPETGKEEWYYGYLDDEYVDEHTENSSHNSGRYIRGDVLELYTPLVVVEIP